MSTSGDSAGRPVGRHVGTDAPGFSGESQISGPVAVAAAEASGPGPATGGPATSAEESGGGGRPSLPRTSPLGSAGRAGCEVVQRGACLSLGEEPQV
uniref:Lymphocyte expansion molecule n=1 Tax=Myotis myotis TaxID=51298 RepID=A0A7J7ZX19_MYOMY|nr:lymphocyte expansion molecule [Myotis myotis]